MDYTSPALQPEMEKSQEWKCYRVFSGGGKQKGERKRLKNSSSYNETRNSREKPSRKAHFIPRSELPSALASHLLPSTEGADIGPDSPASAPTLAGNAEEADGGCRTQPQG